MFRQNAGVCEDHAGGSNSVTLWDLWYIYRYLPQCWGKRTFTNGNRFQENNFNITTGNEGKGLIS